MTENTIIISKTKIKENCRKSINFFKQKKVLNIIIIVFLLALLIGGSWIRLQNLELLKDSTTGEYIPLALDPFYFLRLAETISEAGSLPAFDAMRYPSLQVGFSNEILPQAIVLIHDIWSIFDNTVSIQFVDVVSPVIFFALGLLVFFFLILLLTKSKIVAAVSSFLLAIIPAYLYRTMAGFSDHEAIGMFAFFLALLCYTLALKFLDRENTDKKLFKKTILLALLAGLTSIFTILSWGGIANFIFLIIPLSFAIIWLIKSKNISKDFSHRGLFKYLIFYIVWFFSSIFFSILFGYGLKSIIGRFLSSSGIIGPALLLFIIIDYILILKKDKLKNKLKKYRILFSALATLVVGFFISLLFGQNIIPIIGSIAGRLLTPFGDSRIGLTVAENAQPYLTTWISQIGKTFFWLFFGGAIFLGFNLAKGISKKKNKIGFSLVWMIMISGILFSRISQESILNGVNFISKSVYFIGVILFLAYLIFLYFNDEIKIKNELILIFVWLFVTLITVRGAVRLFFIITPVFCFMVGYFLKELYTYAKKSKDDLLKLFLWILFGLAILGIILSSIGFWNTSVQQGKYTSPSATVQWQEAMDWVRENTQKGEIFVHWWDYGYWVQYLGERPSIADGGHGNTFWDHLIGRYVLTTPFPETAFSFMKSHDVDYLLIDSTDIGKYPAYSSIGSDETGGDRTSWIQTMLSNPSEIQETREGMIKTYQGRIPLDEDLYYESEDGKETFLPKGKSLIIGVFLEFIGDQVKQPKIVYLFNNEQIRLPVKSLYFNGELFNFGTGIDSTIYLYPSVFQTNEGLKIDQTGAVMYLSEKVKDSLVSKLYLMNDPNEEYSELELVYDNNGQGMYYYRGFVGPIKIWEVGKMENILVNKKFLNTEGDYAEFDDLVFEK